MITHFFVRKFSVSGSLVTIGVRSDLYRNKAVIVLFQVFVKQDNKSLSSLVYGLLFVLAGELC